jgi:hypothetical protein
VRFARFRREARGLFSFLLRRVGHGGLRGGRDDRRARLDDLLRDDGPARDL